MFYKNVFMLNRMIVIKDVKWGKGYQNHIEGKLAFTERIKADFMKESISEKRFQVVNY